MNALNDFLTTVENSVVNNIFVKLTISDRRCQGDDAKAVYIRPVQIKAGLQMSFVYRYEKKDITKNLSLSDSIKAIEQLLVEKYKQADLYTTEADYHLLQKNENFALKKKAATQMSAANLQHDKVKNRFVDLANSVYLRELGVVGGDGKLKVEMTDKYLQINKYIEIIDGILKNENIDNQFSVVDMGSGKGYLTFALYDYLQQKMKKNASVLGVEIRPELVDYCNTVAKKIDFENLKFITGAIESVELPKINMLVALHACNTATDDAIYRGIKQKAQIIVCAPCCHKQIRPQIKPDNALELITRHGILCERQAEIITDAIRASILESYGYKTKVFEFIATEHTPKNVLIVGVHRKDVEQPLPSDIEKINELKKMFGIKVHYLEQILNLV